MSRKPWPRLRRSWSLQRSGGQPKKPRHYQNALRPGEEHPNNSELGEEERRSTTEHISERDVRSHDRHDIAVESDRRRNETNLAHLHDYDAAPDRIVPERDHSRIHDRQGQKQHSDRRARQQRSGGSVADLVATMMCQFATPQARRLLLDTHPQGRPLTRRRQARPQGTRVK